MAWEVNNVIAAILVIGVISIAFKDNIFFKFVERIFIGITLGITLTAAYGVIVNNGIIPILQGNYLVIVADIMGLLLLSRFSKSYSWLSRYTLALIVGMSLAIFTRTAISALIIGSIAAVVNTPLITNNLLGTVSNLYAWVGLVAGLVYFVFTTGGIPKQGKPIFNIFSRIGRYTIMIYFGVYFGSTVLGRETVLLERISFVLRTFGIIP